MHLLVSLLFACGVDPAEKLATAHEPIVGGRAEQGYPAVGYLAAFDGATYVGPTCTASVIAPRVAITAAHCVRFDHVEVALGFGAPADEVLVPALRIIRHPDFSTSRGGLTSAFDIALLVFDQDLPVEPLIVGRPELDASLRFVGYGRATEGRYGTPGDESIERRRSAAQTVTRLDGDGTVWARGVDGGLCWGDSGGPLLSEDGTTVYGVLSQFGERAYCEAGGYEMIFAVLDDLRSFWEPIVEASRETTADYVGLIEPGSTLAASILTVVNDASEDELDFGVDLERRAITSILTHRAGEDRRLATEDDVRIETLDALDALPLVDRQAFAKLAAYVQDR